MADLHGHRETIRRAALWTPEQQAAADGVRAPDRAAVDGAWAAVLATIRRTGDDLKAMEMLDETTRQAVKAIGYLGQVRRMEPGRNDRTMRARFAEARYPGCAGAGPAVRRRRDPRRRHRRTKCAM